MDHMFTKKNSNIEFLETIIKYHAISHNPIATTVIPNLVCLLLYLHIEKITSRIV